MPLGLFRKAGVVVGELCRQPCKLYNERWQHKVKVDIRGPGQAGPVVHNVLFAACSMHGYNRLADTSQASWTTQRWQAWGIGCTRAW